MSLPYFNQVCYATLGHERPWSMETYRQLGGYEVWKKVLAEKTPRDVIIEEVKSSRLRGCGDAGFPTGLTEASHGAAHAGQLRQEPDYQRTCMNS